MRKYLLLLPLLFLLLFVQSDTGKTQGSIIGAPSFDTNDFTITDNEVSLKDGADGTAIHDNVASEINGISEKGTPVSGDLLIIEDSEDSNNKKKIQIGNLPTTGGGEANTASSQGSGTSLFYQKSGIDLQFNAIKSESDDITVSLDGTSHDVELTFNPGNVASSELSDTADILYETELDSEAELEGQLVGVTNVFTNNDGALNDDDVTLADVQGACSNDFHSIGGTDDDTPDNDSEVPDAITINPVNATTESAIESVVDHDDLQGFVENEHIDWTQDQGATNIHSGNYTDTDTQLSEEEVEDYAGGMFTGNTETRVTVTYQDDDGTIDIVVDDMNDDQPDDDSEVPDDITIGSGGSVHIDAIPTAAPRDGDTGNVTLSDHVYDFCETTQDYLKTSENDDDAASLGNIQSACTNDFHNIGGTDDDVPEAGDFGNLTAGTSLSWSPAGTLNVDDDFIKLVGDTTGAMTEDLNLDANSLVISYDDNLVGIGTATPAENLHIYENTASSVEIEIENSEGAVSIGSDGGYLWFYDGGTNVAQMVNDTPYNSLYVGQNDTAPGRILAMGNTTGSPLGGGFYCYMAADYDGTDQSWSQYVYEDDLIFGLQEATGEVLRLTAEKTIYVPTTTTFDGDLIPSSDGTKKVGNTSNRWAEGYYDQLVVDNLRLDGSTLDNTANGGYLELFGGPSNSAYIRLYDNDNPGYGEAIVIRGGIIVEDNLGNYLAINDAGGYWSFGEGVSTYPENLYVYENAATAVEISMENTEGEVSIGSDGGKLNFYDGGTSVGNMNISGSAYSLTMGAQGSGYGDLVLSGAATSTGGTIGILTADDSDTTTDYYLFYANGENLQINSDNLGQFVTFDGQAGYVSFGDGGGEPGENVEVYESTADAVEISMENSEGEVSIGADGGALCVYDAGNQMAQVFSPDAGSAQLTVGVASTYGGSMVLRGSATGSSFGGYIQFDTAEDYNTTIPRFLMGAVQDDFQIRQVNTAHFIIDDEGYTGVGASISATIVDENFEVYNNVADPVTIEITNSEGSVEIEEDATADGSAELWARDEEGDVTLLSADIFMAYANTAQTDVDAEESLDFDQEVRKDNGYTHSTVTNPEQITVENGGDYRISYAVSFDSDYANRVIHKVFLEDDGTPITYSTTYCYTRDASTAPIETCSGTFLVNIAASSVITLQMIANPAGAGWGHANADSDTIAGECWILIERIGS